MDRFLKLPASSTPPAQRFAHFVTFSLRSLVEYDRQDHESQSAYICATELVHYFYESCKMLSSRPYNTAMNHQRKFVIRGWGGGVQAYNFGKKDSELGVGGEGQDTSRHF